MKKLVPDFYAKNIFSLDAKFFIDNGIKYIFSDLDNTLDAFDSLTPNEETMKYVKSLLDAGLKFYIVSNNSFNRVNPFASALGVEFIYHTGKPFGFRLKKFIIKKAGSTKEAILIGDQLLTDVIAAKSAKVRVCLTDQLVKRDQWTTFFNRKIDNRLRNKMLKKGLISRIGG